MKKLLLLSLSVLLVFTLISCNTSGVSDPERETNPSEINRYIPLDNDVTLYVGSNKTYTNYEVESITPEYLNQLVSVTYTLRRSSYANGYDIPYVEYENYYYYWNTENTHEEILLGSKTVKTTCRYEYMPFGEANNINIRTIRTTETTYDYEGGFVTKDFDYTVDVGYYFDSWEDLQEKCPDLAKQINTSGSKKYYVDVTSPNTVTYDTYTATDTYYYFENNVISE